MFFNLFKKIPAKRNSLSKDQRGIAAVEFALVVPIIVILLLGSIDAVFALTAKRKVSLATHSMADIAARETALDSTDRQALSELGKVIMTPNDVTLANIIITGALVDSNGTTATVDWSEGFGPSALAPPINSKINLPSALTPGVFLVVTETTLPYETLSSVMFNLSETAYFQSRSGLPIDGT
ncbi:MAG: TadE/TadG family type IV pilus assembly protein [Hyphomicrobiales bacterium]